MTDQVHVKGNYTLGNQWLVTLGVFRNWFFSKIVWIIVAVWSAFYAYFFFVLHYPSDGDELVNLVAVGALLIFVTPIYSSFLTLLIFAAKSKLRPRPFDVTYDERGITLVAPSGSGSTFSWKDIKRLVEFDRAFLMTAHCILSIPKENFDHDDLAKTRQLAIEHLGARAKMKSS